MRRRTNLPTYYVSRQAYWYSQAYVVEVTDGGIDHAGADMLTPYYPGEGVEYDSAVEAIEAAIAIRDAWRCEFGITLSKDIRRSMDGTIHNAYAAQNNLLPGQLFWDSLDGILQMLDECANILGSEWPDVATGSTGGMGLELEPTDLTDEELRAWAQGVDDARPTCDRCGQPRKETYHIYADPDLGDFCSEYCAETAWADGQEDEDESWDD